MRQVCINHRRDDKLGVVFLDFTDVKTDSVVGSVVINYWENRCFLTDLNYKPDLSNMLILSGVKDRSLNDDRLKDIYYSFNEQLQERKAKLQCSVTQFKQYFKELLNNDRKRED